MNDEIKELIKLSFEIGNRPDFVQGGGGNVSAKSDSENMIVKASGFRLSELMEDEGFVVVNHPVIKSFYEERGAVVINERVFEDDKEAVQKSVIRKISSDFLRPSIETGFHALLQKYVIHTHSVYVNAFACAENGEDALNSLIKPLFQFLWVPYARPGAPLAFAIKRASEKFKSERGILPEVIILENHGVIVGGETGARCSILHEELNNTLREFLGAAFFPSPKIIQKSENIYESGNNFLRNFILENLELAARFSEIVLFPDQEVYCEKTLTGEKKDGAPCKIFIDTGSGRVIYNANFKEALAIEETITAWAYILDKIKHLGLSSRTISENDRKNITNMESEEYRKKLLRY